MSEFKGYKTIADDYSLLCIKFLIKLWYEYKMLVCESDEKHCVPYYKISIFSINYLKLFVWYRNIV